MYILNLNKSDVSIIIIIIFIIIIIKMNKYKDINLHLQPKYIKHRLQVFTIKISHRQTILIDVM